MLFCIEERVRMATFDSLPSQQQELIKRHLDLVIEANKTMNLTRIDTVEEGMLLHVEDSLVGLDELNQAPDGLYGDLGTGAGYPGIPLAIASERETTLIDARLKKTLVLDNFIEELGLVGQVSTFAGRAELLAKTRSKRYVALTARALSKLSVLMELASPLLKKGGILICYKAQVDDEEISNAKRIEELVGMTINSDRTLKLSDNETTRRIITFKKINEPKTKLPRQEGMAQKKPL